MRYPWPPLHCRCVRPKRVTPGTRRPICWRSTREPDPQFVRRGAPDCFPWRRRHGAARDRAGLVRRQASQHRRRNGGHGGPRAQPPLQVIDLACHSAKDELADSAKRGSAVDRAFMATKMERIGHQVERATRILGDLRAFVRGAGARAAERDAQAPRSGLAVRTAPRRPAGCAGRPLRAGPLPWHRKCGRPDPGRRPNPARPRGPRLRAGS